MSPEKVVTLDVNYVDRVVKPEIELPRVDLSEFFLERSISEEIDQLWVKNYLENKDRIRPFPICHLGAQRATIIVGASTALKKNWHHLKEIDDKFVLICTPTTLKFLQANGIRIDYVFALEGRHHWLSDIDCDTSRLTLIASPYIYPEIIKNWKGEVWFYMIGGGKEYERRLREDWYGMNPVEVGGGNAVSTSFLWAYKFLASRCFVFVGTSFCYYDDYYFDGRPQPVENLEILKNFTFNDIRGKVVRTTPTLFTYKMWLEMAMEKATGAEFVNATEDGILGVWPEPIQMRGTEVWGRWKYLPWLNIIPLNLAIEAYKKKFGGNNGSRK